jgi:hypothetical protein
MLVPHTDRDHPHMAIQVNLRRRWFGSFHLIVSGGLLIWGLTLLRPVLRGWLFLGYWLACFLFALLALITGWLDWRSVRRQARAERRELLFEALHRANSGPPSSPEPPNTPTPRSPHPGDS